MNKVSWADRARTVLCRLAGDSEQGRVFLLARHDQLHTYAIFSVFNFERGRNLRLPSVYIYSKIIKIDHSKNKLFEDNYEHI